MKVAYVKSKASPPKTAHLICVHSSFVTLYVPMLWLSNGCLFNTFISAILRWIQLSSMCNTRTYSCILRQLTNFCHNMYIVRACLILCVYPYMWNRQDCSSLQIYIHKQKHTQHTYYQELEPIRIIKFHLGIYLIPGHTHTILWHIT
jgi:hypothetical protein